MKIFERSKFLKFSNYIYFIKVMTEKEIKIRYKKAFFGFLWIIFNPILQMIVIGIIFSFFINIPNYFTFLFTGLLPWTFFSLSLNKTTPSIVYERSLLQKAKFPIEAIPISIILSNFLHMLASFLIFFIFIIFTKNVLFPQILLIFPAIFWLLIITTSVSLITTTLNVFYRDINFFVQTTITLLFYATPIMYSFESIPNSFTKILVLNPLSSPFQIFHYSFLGTDPVSLNTLVINIIQTIILLIFGILIFNKYKKYFVDLL